VQSARQSAYIRDAKLDLDFVGHSKNLKPQRLLRKTGEENCSPRSSQSAWTTDYNAGILQAFSALSTSSAVEGFDSRRWNQLMCGNSRSTFRRFAISSAVIATAISSGVIAPISSPTGAYTRLNSSGASPSF